MNNRDDQPAENLSENDSQSPKIKMSYLAFILIGLSIGIGLALVSNANKNAGDMGGAGTLSSLASDSQIQTDESGGFKTQEDKTALKLQLANNQLELEERDPIEDVRDAFADRANLNVMPSPTYHPRPESEWQGMLVDTSLQALCDGKNSCGLAMACKKNRCGPCGVDADCDDGESCVLDHCVLEKKMECRTSSDCASGELCILSGYSTDPRGNADTRSYCQSTVAGTQPTPENNTDPIAKDPGPPVFSRSVSIDQLRETLLEQQTSDQISPETVDSDTIEAIPDITFDEESEEEKFQRHEQVDETDPEEEHVIIEEENSWSEIE